MIDEITEAKGYLRGEIGSKNIYRACYMVAKYYKRSGVPKKDALANVLEWAKTYHVDAHFSIAGCVAAAYENDRMINDMKPVAISEQDKEVISRFVNTRTEKMLALALVCYAKAFADSDGVFDVSFWSLANWIGVDRSNLYRRQYRNLAYFGFIERVDNISGWDKKSRNVCRFKLLVPYTSGGEYVLEKNDLSSLCDRVFPN